MTLMGLCFGAFFVVSSILFFRGGDQLPGVIIGGLSFVVAGVLGDLLGVGRSSK